MSSRFGVALMFVLLVGCDGRIGNISRGPGSGNGSRSGSLTCATTDTGFQPLRRLSSAQVERTLRDLFGGEIGNAIAEIAHVPETEIVSGFSTEADANVVNTATATAFEDAAQAIGEYLIANATMALPQLMPCGLGSYGDSEITACIDQFIEEFGLRAYRRPLTADEKQVLRAVYDDIDQSQTATEAWAAVVQVMVQSPQFLYLAEPGADPVEGAEHLVELDDYEMAARLSYFLNNTMPDDELFAAAARGEIETLEQIEAQARRLVGKDELIDVLATFHNEWLGLYDFEGLAKIPSLFPGFDDSVRTAMSEEIRRLTEHVMNDLDGSVSSLLSATDYEVPQELAFVYGLSEAGLASTGTGFRAGALTTSAFLATHAHEDASSVIQRGVFIRRAVLCGDLAPPRVTDDQREVVLSPAAEARTARERLEPLTQTAECSSCHLAINPLGLGLENFDALGQWRDTENETMIDPSGTIDQAADANGPFGDVGGLIDLISDSTTVQHCYSEKLFRFAVGRFSSEEDGCALDELSFAANQFDGNIRELLVSMTLTHSFRYRRRLP